MSETYRYDPRGLFAGETWPDIAIRHNQLENNRTGHNFESMLLGVDGQPIYATVNVAHLSQSPRFNRFLFRILDEAGDNQVAEYDLAYGKGYENPVLNVYDLSGARSAQEAATHKQEQYELGISAPSQLDIENFQTLIGDFSSYINKELGRKPERPQ